MKNLKNLGKTLNKQEQIQINGGCFVLDPNGLCEDFPFLEECNIDAEGRDCRFPFFVNSFGRCTLG